MLFSNSIYEMTSSCDVREKDLKNVTQIGLIFLIIYRILLNNGSGS